MVPNTYYCAGCERRRLKQSKQAAKIKSKKSLRPPTKPVAPLDLLLSVAEGRIYEVKGESNLTSFKKFKPKVAPAEVVTRKAIIENGYVYLSTTRKIEDCTVKMKLQHRGLFESLYTDFGPNTSR